MRKSCVPGDILEPGTITLQVVLIAGDASKTFLLKLLWVMYSVILWPKVS